MIRCWRWSWNPRRPRRPAASGGASGSRNDNNTKNNNDNNNNNKNKSNSSNSSDSSNNENNARCLSERDTWGYSYPYPCSKKSCTNFQQLYYVVVRIGSANCPGHGHGYAQSPY